MAIVYPNPIPSFAIEDPEREAERKMYEVFSSGLDGGYRVFYDVAWLARTDRTHDGEADFVLAHPELGVTVVEVRGVELDTMGVREPGGARTG